MIDTLGSGGAQRQIISLAKALCVKGHEVTLLYYNGPHYFLSHIKDLPIRVEFVQKKSKIGWGLFWQIRSFIKANSFDIACSFMIAPSLFLLVGNRLAGRKVKCIISERTFEAGVSNLHKKFRLSYHFADYILANSSHQQAVLKELFPNYVNRIRSIGNGVFLNEFNYRKDYVFSSDKLHIVAIGRIVVLKNIRTLISALNILVNNFKVNAYVAYVGREPVIREDVAEQEMCLQLLKEFHLEERWTWVGEVNNVDQYLEQNDVLVHTSFGEGFPNAVCEAMIKGIPVFASNVCDHPKVIEHGKSGYLFDPRNAEELAAFLYQFHHLTLEEKRKMVAEARSFAEKNFDIEVVATKYESLFKSLLSENHS